LSENEAREMFALQDDDSIEGLVDSINLNDAYMSGDAARVRELIAEIKQARASKS
jgi:hypothetical protein